MSKNLKIIFFGFLFLTIPFIVRATEIEFNVDSSYDYQGRSKITSFLYQMGQNVYFYVENDYYKNLDIEKIKEFSQSLKSLSQEFDEVIYPKLTQLFGFEWKPGIDQDERILVLLTQIKGESGGYFNSGDEYKKAEVFNSNEREMLYLNVKYINDPLIKSFLAHEFIHLIVFNQKNKKFGLQEEIWLNEATAEAAPTLLGYDETYQGSNLQRRVKIFSQNPGDSLTEWKNISADYGVINIFIQYLIDHYGKKVLVDSLHSQKTGIPSLNEALKKNGYSVDFSQIFTDWLLAILVNDCGLGEKYCFLNQNLKNLRILPQLNYLPLVQESALRVSDFTKNWSGNWFKFIGGKGTLKIEFIGDEKVNFKVSYLTQDSLDNYSLSFMDLGKSQRGTIFIPDFGRKYISLTIIPSIQEKLFGFDGLESFYQFIWLASIINDNPGEGEEELINQLLAQIEVLKRKIAEVQAQLKTLSCFKFENNLFYGIKNNSEVRCLQEFLKNQGKDIYPEGLVTGNFFSATLAAVTRFQEKYRTEILTPLGFARGTGFVGAATRAKINDLTFIFDKEKIK